MTATTIPHPVPTHRPNGLLKVGAALAAGGALIAGSFALGRSTADDAPATIVREAPVVVTPAPSVDDVPSVALRPHVAAAATATVPSPDDVPSTSLRLQSAAAHPVAAPSGDDVPSVSLR